MQEYQMLVPQSFNDGNPIPLEEIITIERELAQRFGGFTRIDGLSGAWRAPDGTVFYDKLTNYIVATDDEDQLIDFVQHLGRRLRQRAMYVRRQSSVPIIIDAHHGDRIHDRKEILHESQR